MLTRVNSNVITYNDQTTSLLVGVYNIIVVYHRHATGRHEFI